MERLVICQGTAQLVTAVSALRHHLNGAAADTCLQSSKDHLLICGLAVPDDQATEFALVIERMAVLLHPFSSISCLSDSRLNQLIKSARQVSDVREIGDLFRATTNFGNIDEVFAVRDWQACNELAFSAYPEATHICYGDSVGVYLPRDFMMPRRGPWSWFSTRLRRILQRQKSLLDNPRVDVSYLLLPGAFGVPPSGQVIQTQVASLRGVFASLSPLLGDSELEDIRRKTAGRSVWILIGSNFSEQALMAPEAEASAYRDWIETLHPEPGAVLLIKSHPRDYPSKRALLQRHLSALFDEVWFADSVGSAYLPIEVLLLELQSVVGSLRCLTVSTACLGTHFVLGCKTDIGLGEALVTQYLAANRVKERVRHERDLKRLCMA